MGLRGSIARNGINPIRCDWSQPMGSIPSDAIDRNQWDQSHWRDRSIQLRFIPFPDWPPLTQTHTWHRFCWNAFSIQVCFSKTMFFFHFSNFLNFPTAAFITTGPPHSWNFANFQGGAQWQHFSKISFFTNFFAFSSLKTHFFRRCAALEINKWRFKGASRLFLA